MSNQYKQLGELDIKSRTLLESLKPFYEIKKNTKILFDLVSSKSTVSLRVLDWFVSNYSKKNDTSYEVRGVIFNVFFQYKARLKSFSKRLFDPFRRGEKITFKDKTSGDEIQTTVGQLNFFKWCIDNDIFVYVKQHVKNIEDDMNNTQKKPKEVDDTKRHQLSTSTLKTMNKKSQRTIVDFS